MLLKACVNPPTQKYGKWMLRVLGERSMGKSTQKLINSVMNTIFLIIELKLTKTKIKTQYLPLAEATRG